MKKRIFWPQAHVDTEIFYPGENNIPGLTRTVFSYTGHIAVEKNIKAFLDLDLPGSKLIIGDGPDLEKLKNSIKM